MLKSFKWKIYADAAVLGKTEPTLFVLISEKTVTVSRKKKDGDKYSATKMKMHCALGFERQCQDLRLLTSRAPAAGWRPVSGIHSAKTNIVLRTFYLVLLFGTCFTKR
jgi:hypothetical protein